MAAGGQRSGGTGSTQALALRPQALTASVTTTQTITGNAVLHLRGAPQVEGESEIGDENSRRRIQWAEDVVDNEGLGRKKSKVCCIYHAPRNIDSSSDESSSDSDSDASDSGDDGAARMSGGGHHCGSGDGHKHKHSKKTPKGKGKERARSPNAYEKTPKVKNKGAANEKSGA